jgi:hypothetical protein
MIEPAKISQYLLRFAGWSVFFVVIYHIAFDDYAAVVVQLADVLTDLIVPVSIQSELRGLVVYSPEASHPMGVPYSLYQIGLNAIFAPALVLATTGMTTSGAIRSVAAILVMILLHSVEVWSIVLFHISHPENTAIALGLADSTVSTIAWFYRFLDRMAYAFFPFLAWIITSGDVIARLFATSRSQKNESHAKT